MRILAAVAVCVLLDLSSPGAQGAKPDSAGSELGFYIGKWTEEGQSRAKPTDSFGKITGEESCAWFSGGPSVVCRETTQDKNGETDSIYILAYDTARKLYTVNGTDNTGAIYSGTGTVNNGVWRWTAEMRAAGAVTPMRYTFRPVTGGGRAMEIEVPAGKGTWAKIVGVTYKSAR